MEEIIQKNKRYFTQLFYKGVCVFEAYSSSLERQKEHEKELKEVFNTHGYQIRTGISDDRVETGYF